MKKVTVTVDDTGKAFIDMEGFHGQGCDKLMTELVGKGVVTKEVKKREFYEREVEKEKVKAKQ